MPRQRRGIGSPATMTAAAGWMERGDIHRSSGRCTFASVLSFGEQVVQFILNCSQQAQKQTAPTRWIIAPRPSYHWQTFGVCTKGARIISLSCAGGNGRDHLFASGDHAEAREATPLTAPVGAPTAPCGLQASSADERCLAEGQALWSWRPKAGDKLAMVLCTVSATLTTTKSGSPGKARSKPNTRWKVHGNASAAKRGQRTDMDVDDHAKSPDHDRTTVI